ncbi:hypothetical protein OIU79_002129 [Salix purpurea]|uniref:Uncharacterized protein n=1 Tax=Salix purpurea TaxID=77065 RepID=A0A9Q0US02_SALPP|nr:hypothetical protein OIU79_002129 [Salix purpurea]
MLRWGLVWRGSLDFYWMITMERKFLYRARLVVEFLSSTL